MDKHRNLTMPSDQDLNRFFAEASQEFLNLYKQSAITDHDISGRSWMERYTIASELWFKCDLAARDLLVSDPHEAVSAVAQGQKNSATEQQWSPAAKPGGDNVSQTTI